MEVAVSPPPSKVTDDSGDESGAPRPLYESISLALRDSIHSVASQRNLFMGAPSTSSDEEKSTNKASLMDKEKEPDEMEKTGETVGTCSICFEDAALFTLSGCKHQFCVDCLGAYLEERLRNRDKERRRETTRTSWYASTKLSDVKAAMSKLKRFQKLASSPELRECPKCLTLNKPKEEGSTLVECKKCKMQYCLLHHNAHPPSVSCEEYEETCKKLGGKKTAKILKNTRRCPSCGVATERSTGCPMMTCPCKTVWCYRCVCVGDSEATYRCTKCGASGWRHLDEKPSWQTTCCAVVCSPLWVPCGFCWCACCFPCAFCDGCRDPDPDKIWQKNNERNWQEISTELGGEAKHKKDTPWKGEQSSLSSL